MIDVDERLAELSLEAGDDDRASTELVALREVASALAEALPPEPASASLRARLMASAGASEHRFAPFTRKLAQMIDVSLSRAGELLARIADPSAWIPAPEIADGVELIHLQGGPATVGADVGFVRVAPGVEYPDHVHHGGERVLFLQGAQREPSGAVARAGDELELAPGSRHDFVALPGEPLIFAVVVFDVEFPGRPDALRSRPQ